MHTDLLSKIAEQVVNLAEVKTTPIILIDGPAAAGKSTFAKELQNKTFKELEQSPKLIHMDDLYPGWEGLREGSNYLLRNILEPISKGKAAAWQIWDWEKSERGNDSEPGNGWREFKGGTPLIIEGCGSLSRASKELADLAIWMDAPLEIRQERFSQRDNGAYDQHWSTWMTQEQEFYKTEKSAELAVFKIAS